MYHSTIKNRQQTNVILPFLIIIVMFVAVLSSGFSPWYWLAIISSTGLLFVLLVPLFQILKNNSLIIQPYTFFAMTSMGYVLSSTFLMLGGHSRSLNYVLNDTRLPSFALATFYAFIGSLMFYISYAIVFPEYHRAKILFSKRSRVSNTKLILAIILLSIVGLIGYYLFISSSGGIRHLAENILHRHRLRTTDYFRFITTFLQAATYLWWMCRPRAYKSMLFWGHVLLNLFVLGSMGSAGPVIFYVAFLMSIQLLRVGNLNINRLPYGRYVLIMVILYFVLMIGRIGWREASAIAGRDSSQQLTVDLVAARSFAYFSDSQQFLSSWLGGATINSIESFANVVELVPQDIDYLWGETFYWVVITPIPRVWWPDKPSVNLGIYVKRQMTGFEATGGGVPISWFGELYLNFGAWGIVPGSLLFGLCSGLVARWFVRRSHMLVTYLFFIAFSLVFVLFLSKTELKTAINGVAAILVPLFVAMLILHTRVRINPKL